MSRMKWLLAALVVVVGLCAAETAQAQVRVSIGVGGPGPRYYPRYYPYGGSVYVGPGYYYGPRVVYPAPAIVVGSPPPIVVGSPPPVVVDSPSSTVVPVPSSSTSAHIHVLLPDPNAQVWFDGSLTRQVGVDRMFHTPDLPSSGSYNYRIRAAWRVGGQDMVQERVVSVSAGQTATADFRGPTSEIIPLPARP